MNEAILVLNAGSSSIKFAAFAGREQSSPEDALCDGECEGIGHRVDFAARDGAGNPRIDKHLGGEATTNEDALAAIPHWLEGYIPEHRMVAAGHLVVHGGSLYVAPVLIDDVVIAELRRLIPLAPLHQPQHLAAIEALTKLHPTLPQIACFDTAFPHTQPEVASTFALPRRLTEEGIRRHDFHGLSYEFIASAAPHVIEPDHAQGRVIVAHLGSGASICAMLLGGRHRQRQRM